MRTTKGGKAPVPGITQVKLGQTQIKAIGTPGLAATNSQPPLLTAISNHSFTPLVAASASSASMLSTINSVANNSFTSGNSLPTPSLPTVHLPPAAAAISNSLDASRIELKLDSKMSNANSTSLSNRNNVKTMASSLTKSASKKKKDSLDKDDKSSVLGSASAMAASTSFFQQPSISMSSYGDDDINDVAAMGGVNLAEESQRILGCTENIGTQIRSCKDEVFLHLPALHARIRAMVAERGLEEPSQDVAVLISHACQERLKNIVEKLAVIAEHRIDVIKVNAR